MLCTHLTLHALVQSAYEAPTSMVPELTVLVVSEPCRVLLISCLSALAFGCIEQWSMNR